MGTFLIVNVLPITSQKLRLHHGVHDFAGEPITPELRIKRLNKTVP